MKFTIEAAQVWFAFWFALFMSGVLPPRGFGLVKRLIGFAVLFLCVMAYAVADNNLQLLKR